MLRGYRNGLISAYNQVPFFCPMGSSIYLLYCAIQDFVQKALFSEIQAIRSGWGNYVR